MWFDDRDNVCEIDALAGLTETAHVKVLNTRDQDVSLVGHNFPVVKGGKEHILCTESVNLACLNYALENTDFFTESFNFVK